MQKESNNQYLVETGEILSIFDRNSIPGPAKVKLVKEGKTVFGEINGTKYELDISEFGEFPNLVNPDPQIFLDSAKARDQDKGQDDLSWLKDR